MEDIALSYLGSGYDVCGEYADAGSIKRKLFDFSRVPKRDIRQLSNRKSDFFSVVGSTVEEYQGSLSVKAGISGSYGLFSGSVEASFDSTDLSITESSFISIEVCIQFETWKLQTRATDYIYPDVLEDFKTKDGKLLIEEYGGGVVMGLDIGGRWVDNLVTSKLYEDSTAEVESAMEAAYGLFLSGHGSAAVTKAVKKEKSIASRRVNVIGGNPAFAPWKVEEWQASVEKNPSFMNFTTSDGLVMLWDIFPEYTDKLKKGFNEYVKEHQLNIHKKQLISAMYIEAPMYSSDARSGADQDLDLYKPSTSGSYTYLGVSGNSNKVLVLKELSDRYGALREPVDWQPVWNDRGSVNKQDYNCWIPVGPPEFVALGVYCRFRVDDQGPPSKDEANGLVVVHRSLVEPCDFVTTDVWSDHGSTATYDLTLGRLPDQALWPSHTTDPRAGELPSKYSLKKEFIKS